MAIFLVPCAAAVLYGWRGNRVRDRRGLVALVIGALAGLGFMVMSIVTIVAGTLSGREGCRDLRHPGDGSPMTPPGRADGTDLPQARPTTRRIP